MFLERLWLFGVESTKMSGTPRPGALEYEETVEHTSPELVGLPILKTDFEQT